jgi:hypothetical protein
VLDIDNRHNGDKTLQRLTDEYEIDLNHAITVNCSNGLHIYVTNLDLKNTAGQIGDGLDIRSEGGFVVAPNSLHKSGKNYSWKLIGETTKLPDEWFYSDTEDDDDLAAPRTSNGNSSVAESLKDIRLPARLTSDYVIPEGQREQTLFKWACRERGKGANAETIFDILITIRDMCCETGQEPVTNEEIRNIAICAASYPTNAEKGSQSFTPRNN